MFRASRRRPSGRRAAKVEKTENDLSQHFSIHIVVVVGVRLAGGGWVGVYVCVGVGVGGGGCVYVMPSASALSGDICSLSGDICSLNIISVRFSLA